MARAPDPPDAPTYVLSDGAALRLLELVGASDRDPLDVFAAFATADGFVELVNSGFIDDYVSGYLERSAIEVAARHYELTPEAARRASDLPGVVRALRDAGRIAELLLAPDVLRGIAAAIRGDAAPLAAAIDTAFVTGMLPE
jgi:hypothetical protein